MAKGFRRSDTATTPYPTHQAIVTPASSRGRGDWGLKRALPSRPTTRSSTTSLQITALDTNERITDYESATDHTKTLEKFTELGLALTKRGGLDRITQNYQAAFFPEFDYTDKQDAPSQGLDEPSRWKFTGKNVAAMTDGEFSEYVNHEIKRRKTEFDEFLRARLHTQLLDTHRRTAIRALNDHHGKAGGVKKAGSVDAPAENTSAKQADASEIALEAQARFFTWLSAFSQDEFNTMRVSYVDNMESSPSPPDTLPSYSNFIPVIRSTSAGDSPETQQNMSREGAKAERDFMLAYPAQYKAYTQDRLKVLRADTKLYSDLNKLIREFLDMRPASTGTGSADKAFGNNSETTGLTTHPSAGLSYLRTNAVLENHPILGPQKSRAPYEARVLSPRSMDRRGQPSATLGLAGFAIAEPTQGTTDRHSDTYKLDTVGGGKVLVNPKNAFFESDGTLRIMSGRPPNLDALRINRGSLSRPESELVRPSAASRSPSRIDRPLDSSRDTVYSGYGAFANRMSGTRKPKMHETNQRLNSLLKAGGKVEKKSAGPGSYPTS
jgi:hypothetical protein